MGSGADKGKKTANAAEDCATLRSDSTPHASPVTGEADQAGSFFEPLKPPLTLDAQIDHLVARGLSLADEDRDFVRRCLSDSNYYRLRGYWTTLEEGSRFVPGTAFSDIWSIAQMDSELRAWLMHAIEPVEIKLRTQLAYHLAHRYGANALEKEEAFSNRRHLSRSLRSLDREVARAFKDGTPCVCHNLEKYGKLPIWASVEVMSFGTTSKLFGNLKESSALKDIADGFEVKARYLKSWVELLTYVRNLCAHSNRFYNRVMKKRPALYQEDRPYGGMKEFPTFLVLRQLHMRSWPFEWPDRLARLYGTMDRHPSVDLAPMGFPENWRDVLGAGSEGGCA